MEAAMEEDVAVVHPRLHCVPWLLARAEAKRSGRYILLAAQTYAPSTRTCSVRPFCSIHAWRSAERLVDQSLSSSFVSLQRGAPALPQATFPAPWQRGLIATAIHMAAPQPYVDTLQWLRQPSVAKHVMTSSPLEPKTRDVAALMYVGVGEEIDKQCLYFILIFIQGKRTTISIQIFFLTCTMI